VGHAPGGCVKHGWHETIASCVTHMCGMHV
jgi:hypothetical protein